MDKKNYRLEFENTLKAIKDPKLVKSLEFGETPLDITYNILQSQGHLDITEREDSKRVMEHFRNNAIFRNYVETLQTKPFNIDKYSQMLKDIDYENLNYKSHVGQDQENHRLLVWYNMMDNVDKTFELVDDRINDKVKYGDFGITPVIPKDFNTAKLQMTIDMVPLQIDNAEVKNLVSDEIKRLYDKNKSKFDFFENNTNLYDSVIQENLINQRLTLVSHSIDYENLDDISYAKRLNLRSALYKEELNQIENTDTLIEMIDYNHEKVLTESYKSFKSPDIKIKSKVQETDDFEY